MATLQIEKRKCVDNFIFMGDNFQKIDHNPDLNIYLYKRTLPNGTIYYEVFKARNTGTEENPVYDGYPGSQQFGKSAMCIPEHRKEKAYQILKNGF